MTLNSFKFQLLNSTLNGENTDSILSYLNAFLLKTQFQSLYILQNSLKGRSDIFSTVLKILNTELKSSLTETKARSSQLYDFSSQSWMMD